MATNLVSIRQNLKTVLEAINGTGSYKTSVTKVAYWTQAVVQIPVSDLPFIGIRPANVVAVHYPNGRIRHEFTVALHCIVQDIGVDETLTKLENLYDDIIYAVNLDTQRGTTGTLKNAVATYDGGLVFEEYTPDNRLASALVTLKIPYHKTTSSS